MEGGPFGLTPGYLMSKKSRLVRLKWKSDSSTLRKRFNDRSKQIFKRLLPRFKNEVFYLRPNHRNLHNFNAVALKIHVINTYLILLFAERTNSGKHHPPKL